jgi:HSP20 family protein
MATDITRKIEDPAEREMAALRNFMDALWNSAFIPVRWLNPSNAFNFEVPPADVEESADQYVVKAALPGWKPEDVNITIKSGTVTIEGKTKEEIEDKDKQYRRKEIVHKSFTRSFSVPGEVKPDQANAEFKDGMLTITLPKSEVMEPKQIKIVAK